MTHVARQIARHVLVWKRYNIDSRQSTHSTPPPRPQTPTALPLSAPDHQQ